MEELDQKLMAPDYPAKPGQPGFPQYGVVPDLSKTPLNAFGQLNQKLVNLNILKQKMSSKHIDEKQLTKLKKKISFSMTKCEFLEKY